MSGADLSPDGRQVVMAVIRSDLEANTDHVDLVLLDVATGEQRALTQVDAANTAPAISPDGHEVAFLSTRDGPAQLYVLALTGGEARAVTAMPRGITGGPVWSPDGSRIAFTAHGPGEARDPSAPYRVRRPLWHAEGLGVVDDQLHEIYVLDLASEEITQLTDDALLNAEPRWAPDGQALVFTSSFDPETTERETQLRRVDLDGTVTDLARGGVVAGHAVCPDGRVVYVLTSEIGRPPGTRSDLWIHDPATGTDRRLTADLDGDVAGLLASDLPSSALTTGTVCLAGDSQHAYVSAQRGGEVHVIEVHLDEATGHRRVLAGPRLCAPLALRGTQLLTAVFTPHLPGDLVLADIATSAEQRLTRLNDELLAELELPELHALKFTSSDGTPVEGWYLAPLRGSRPHPTLLAIHGGPHAGWGHTFAFDFLMLTGAGYGVLYLNHRGSTGYGDAFATAINTDWGHLDCEDLLAGTDHASAEGLADPERLGVFGVSGGGTLTGILISRTNRFKAASPENPLFNFFSIYGSSDLGLFVGHTSMGGPPHEQFEAYRRSSPIFEAHRCTTPTLFLQHEGDHRTPPEQTEQFYAVLKAQGVPAEMLRFPNTGHDGSLLGPLTHRRAQNEALLDWMQRHV
ncbi:prolyl oligopeptidase family serine peptidase [Salinifilum aidingensis]